MTEKKVPKEEWKSCPNCDNSGVIARPVMQMDAYGREYKDWEPEQCEFCWTVEESVFNQTKIRGNQ